MVLELNFIKLDLEWDFFIDLSCLCFLVEVNFFKFFVDFGLFSDLLFELFDIFGNCVL